MSSFIFESTRARETFELNSCESSTHSARFRTECTILSFSLQFFPLLYIILHAVVFQKWKLRGERYMYTVD